MGMTSSSIPLLKLFNNLKTNNMTAVEWLAEQMMHPQIHPQIFNPYIEQALELEKQQIIDFGVWYSGMEQEKVKKAFERFKNETE